MAISLASLKSTTAPAPPRILIHGVAGAGKTTFASGSDKAVFVLTEDGLGVLLVFEDAQGADLNRDGDLADSVLHRLEVR